MKITNHSNVHVAKIMVFNVDILCIINAKKDRQINEEAAKELYTEGKHYPKSDFHAVLIQPEEIAPGALMVSPFKIVLLL